MKLVLFDIDGTLMRANGATTASTSAALSEMYEMNIEVRLVPGLTDPLVIQRVLKEHGISDTVDGAYKERYLAHYLPHLEVELGRRNPEAFAGVPEVLEGLSGNAVLGLLTGNYRAGAELKLTAVGLWQYFQTGGFADDGTTREEIGRRVLEKAKPFGYSGVVVIGDTAHDAAGARAINAKFIGVTHSPLSSGLDERNTDYLFRDFKERDKVLEAILK